MIYVFDTNCFSIAGKHYYPDRFPTFWVNFNSFVQDGKIISVKEVFKELDTNANSDYLRNWIKNNRYIFYKASKEETLFVSKIFKVRNFQNNISQKALLSGTPVADPFLIASAKINNGCVITTEKNSPNAARIPNICKYFNVPCMNFEEFMTKEKWLF